METTFRQATAETEGATAEYTRTGTTAELRIEGEIPELTATAADTPPAVQACCEREIQQLRQSFRSLADGLMEQLGTEGATPSLPRGATRWDEQRSWKKGRGGQFIVGPSAYRVEARIRLPAGPLADAGIVRQALENEADNRELAVRAVYEQIAREFRLVIDERSTT